MMPEAFLDVTTGLIGDNWFQRPSSKTVDGSPHPERQLTLMNSRVINAIAGPQSCWPLAGDQLFVDFDLSAENMPCGLKLAVGSAIIKITAESHTGCRKFARRFGSDALKWVSRPPRKSENLRGIYAKVIQSGKISKGDIITKVGGG